MEESHRLSHVSCAQALDGVKSSLSLTKKMSLSKRLRKKIRAWESPVMIHESLRKLAKLTQVPESMIGVGQQHMPDFFIKRALSKTSLMSIPNKILRDRRAPLDVFKRR